MKPNVLHVHQVTTVPPVVVLVAIISKSVQWDNFVLQAGLSLKTVPSIHMVVPWACSLQLVVPHVLLAIIVMLGLLVSQHINIFVHWDIIARVVKRLFRVKLEHMVHFMDSHLKPNVSHVNQVNIAKLGQHMVNHAHLVIFVRNRDKKRQHYVLLVLIIPAVVLETLPNVVTAPLVTSVVMAVAMNGFKTGHVLVQRSIQKNVQPDPFKIEMVNLTVIIAHLVNYVPYPVWTNLIQTVPMVISVH